MRRNGNQSWVAWGLLVLGLLLLLQTLGWVTPQWMWGLYFSAAGAAFIYAFSQNRQRWWALIPGAALLGLGSQALFFQGPNAPDGAWFLLVLSLGFWGVFATSPARWWAVIPGGVLASLSLMEWFRSEEESLLFGGMALTFAVLFLLGKRWAIFPSVGLLLLAVLSEDWVEAFLSWAWPLALIGVGVYLLWRGGRTRGGGTGA
jgi:hypothetical protein